MPKWLKRVVENCKKSVDDEMRGEKVSTLTLEILKAASCGIQCRPAGAGEGNIGRATLVVITHL